MNEKIKSAAGSVSDYCLSNREILLQRCAAAFCIFAFMITLIRSVVTAITYDEAYTYLFFSRDNMLDPRFLWKLFSKEGCIANNHWLNSFLIFFVTKFIKTNYREFTYNEFMIRLPVLVMYVIFLLAVFQNFRKKKISFTILILMVGNYYLNEFYGLARGYGMANTFIFLLCMEYIDWKKSDFSEMKHLIFAMIYAVLALLSNTIVLLLFPAVGLVCLYRLIQKKNLKLFFAKCWLAFVIFAGVCLLMLVYHLNISSEGKPLFTGDEAGFFECFVKGYVGMYLNNAGWVTAGAVTISVLAAISLLVVNKKITELDFSVMMIIFILLNLIMEQVMQKGYIVSRVLVPFCSFMVLAVSELFSSGWSIVVEKTGRRLPVNCGKIISALVCVFCLGLFMIKIELRVTRDWGRDYKYRTYVDGMYMTGIPYEGPWHASIAFYTERDEDIIEAYMSYIR